MNLELKHKVDKLRYEIEAAVGHRIGNVDSRAKFAMKVEKNLASFATACYGLILKSDIFDYVDFVKSIDANKVFKVDCNKYRKNFSRKNRKYLEVSHAEILRNASYLDRGFSSEKETQSDFENRIAKVLTDLNINIKKNKHNIRGTNNSASILICKKLATIYKDTFNKHPATNNLKGSPSPFDKVCLLVSEFLIFYITTSYSYTPARNSLLMGSATKRTVIEDLKE